MSGKRHHPGAQRSCLARIEKGHDLAEDLAEIIEELPKLTAEEPQAIYRQIEELDGEPQFEATEEMRAAIDEATRSLEAGKGIPLEEVRQRFLAKWATK